MLGEFILNRDRTCSYGPCDQFGAITFFNDLQRSVNERKRRNHSIALNWLLNCLLIPGGAYYPGVGL